MGKKEKNIDHLFKSKLEHYESVPPHDVWDQIISGLDRKKTRIIPVTWKIAATAAILISAVVLTVLHKKDTKPAISELSKSENNQQNAANDTNHHKNMQSELPAQINDPRHEKTKSGHTATLAEHKKEPKKDNKFISSQINNALTKKQQATNKDHYSIQEKPNIQLAELTGLSPAIIENSLKPKVPPGNVSKISDDKFNAGIKEETLEMMRPDPQNLKPHNGKKWSVGGQVSPVYTYREIKKGQYDAVNMSYIDDAEQPLISYSGGINVSYKASERITVQSGLYYARLGQSINDVYSRNIVSDINHKDQSFNYISVSNSVGDISNDPTESWDNNDTEGREESYILIPNRYSSANINYKNVNGEIIQHFEYMEIPVILKYKIIDRNIDFNLITGLSTNVLIGNTAYFKNNSNRTNIGRTSNIDQLNYSGTLGIGLEYEILSKLTLNVDPMFKYYLNSVNKSDQLNTHPYLIGIFTGVSYAF